MNNFLKHISDNNQDKKLFLLSGPCAVENRDICMTIAEKVKRITEELGIDYVFKASYRKANRSSIHSFTGIGDEKALRIIEEVGKQFDLPTITDIHSVQEAAFAAEVVDILQIPAFLCRQTDLLVAAANTGKIVNIKKGQFLSAESMKHAVGKVRDCNNDQIMITERGTTFGYQDLIVDFRGIPTMKEENKVPIVMDCTHSLQRPNQASGVTGGKPQFISTIANAAMATGADGLFIETHPDLSIAKSDAANMLHLDHLQEVLSKAKAIFETVRNY